MLCMVYICLTSVDRKDFFCLSAVINMNSAVVSTCFSNETSTMVANYINFCRNCAIDSKDKKSLIKMIICCMKSIDKRVVYCDLFPGDPYLEWQYVHEINSNAFGGNGACLRMLQYLHFDNIDVQYEKIIKSDREESRNLRMIKVFLESLQKNDLKMSLTSALRKLILYNLAFLNGTAALEQFSSNLLERPTGEEVLKCIASIAQHCFMQNDHNCALGWVLRHCQVADEFITEVQRSINQRETMRQIMTIRNISINSGRPSLLDKLAQKKGHRETISVSIGKSGQSILSGEGMDTFDGWCTRVRFPNTINSTLKHRLYVIMSQPHVNHAYVVSQVIQTPQLSENVIKQRISRPDERILANVIENLDIQMAPFEELTQFIRSCFRAFPQKNLKEMTLLKYMQLYLAAYQHSDLWKECWTQIYPLLSYQVIRDVEEFVKNTKFNETAFIKIISTL